MSDYNRPVIYQLAKDMYIVKKSYHGESELIQPPPLYFGSKRTAQMCIYHCIIKELVQNPDIFIDSLGKDGQISLSHRPKDPQGLYPLPYMHISMEEAKIYE